MKHSGVALDFQDDEDILDLTKPVLGIRPKNKKVGSMGIATTAPSLDSMGVESVDEIEGLLTSTRVGIELLESRAYSERSIWSTTLVALDLALARKFGMVTSGWGIDQSRR